MVDFNLKSYRDRFPEVTHVLFGRSYNFLSLERNFAYLRRESGWLSIGHVLSLYDPVQTPYTRYWPRPDAKQLDLVLKREHVRLAPIGDAGGELVEKLLSVLHSLGLTSLILRFTYPERFAAFSVTVANLLQVQRPGAPETYAAYCEELGAWQRRFQITTVAETEMALWAFHQLSAMAGQNGASEIARRTFDADIWIQRRRVRQALRPFMRNYGPLELARLLAEENPKLAGKIAGEEYERLLQCAVQRFYPRFNARLKGWAETLISLLAQDGLISLEEKTTLRKVWNIRNQAVHPEGDLELAEVENMIDAIERICRRWKQDEEKE